MKIRSGFVSNSSSSSFVCDFCGVVESGYECCLSDFDMTQCEQGHTFCKSHITKEFSPTLEDQYKKLKAYFEDHLSANREALEKYKDRLVNPENKLSSWEESCIARNSEYIENEIKRCEKAIENNKSFLETLEQAKSEGIISGYLVDLYNDLLEETGLPEEYCPVCQRLKQMQLDPEFNTYKRLWEKFSKVTPDGRG